MYSTTTASSSLHAMASSVNDVIGKLVIYSGILPGPARKPWNLIKIKVFLRRVFYKVNSHIETRITQRFGKSTFLQNVFALKVKYDWPFLGCNTIHFLIQYAQSERIATFVKRLNKKSYCSLMQFFQTQAYVSLTRRILNKWRNDLTVCTTH